MKDLLNLGYTRVDVPLTVVGSYEVKVDDETAKVIAFNDNTIELDPDLQYIRFIMCHEGMNANGDTFTKEVLRKAQFTPRFKPVDWEHGQPMIGTILDSRYAEDATGRGYIEAIGVVWKFIYPELADAIKQKSASGELRLSMECYYRDATYKVGDQLYPQEQAEKMGIIPYVGRSYLGMGTVQRVFTDVLFGGVGVVANPADKEAVFLAVAKDLSSQEPTSASELIRPINDLTQRTHDKETNQAVVVAKYVKAFDSAKSTIVASFNDGTLKSKDQLVAEVRQAVDSLVSEITSISNAYYKGVASEEIEEEDAETMATKKKVATENEALETEATETVDETVETTTEVEATEAETTEVEATEAEETTEETVEEVETDEVEETEVDEATAALEARIAELEASLAEKDTAYASLEAKVASLESALASAKASQVLASRMSELTEAGIKFVGQRLAKEEAKIAKMDDEAFSDYKELLIEVAGTSTASSETVEEVETVTASEEEIEEEEITVESAETATAGVIVELEPQKARKPFAHLTR